MKALKYFMVFVFLGLAFSCQKKEYPKPLVVENSAVYYSRLLINNQPIVLQAGVDGYYMYSSYKLDSSFVYGYIADLKKADCSNCTNSLKIQINDYQVSISASPSEIDSALRPGVYPLLAGNPVASYSVQFHSIDDNTFSREWNFGDGSPVENSQDPVHVFNKAACYNVCLTTTSNNNYVSHICNKENFDPNGFRASIAAQDSGGGNSIKFSSIVKKGKSPYQYLWNFGNGTISTQSVFTCHYKYRGANMVTLRVVDALGDTAYATYNAKTATDNSSYLANYSITDVTTIAPVPALSQIIITWVDANGVLYTSNSQLQPSSSSFEILSVESNENNENNQPTKKVTAKFNCRLYNGSNYITVNNAEVVICVAYK